MNLSLFFVNLMEIMGLACVLAVQTSSVVVRTPSVTVAQNWQDWQRQNPTYPGNLPPQSHPSPLRTRTEPARQTPAVDRQASPACIGLYHQYLQRQQAQLQQEQLSLHQLIAQRTDDYHACLGAGSAFCTSRYQRLTNAQNSFKENVTQLDQIQADFALLSRNPQQAATTLPCTERWREAFSVTSPCRRADLGCQ
jgi:hypothetical protein